MDCRDLDRGLTDSACGAYSTATFRSRITFDQLGLLANELLRSRGRIADDPTGQTGSRHRPNPVSHSSAVKTKNEWSPAERFVSGPALTLKVQDGRL